MPVLFAELMEKYMNDYIIMTDSGSDIDPEMLESLGVKCVDLVFRKSDESRFYTNRDMASSDFYREMRNGTVFQTSAVNTAEYVDIFSGVLEQGLDIVYLAFSTGLSASKNFADLAASELGEKYPERKIAVVDSLSGSAGLGLLVYMAVQKKKEGADHDFLVSYVKETLPLLAHWFTVDDLRYLKRGGRINPAAAFAATVLDIKPILHMDDEGYLTLISKVRGRKKAIRMLAEKYLETAAENDGTYFISHGDCFSDAQLLENIIFQNSGKKAALITDIGPVIGSHSGPGTLALFFIGKHR